jgi:hypothetical protein
MKNLILFCFLLSIVSCSTSKTAIDIRTESNVETYRFSVSFYSIGTGIDVKAKQSFMSFLREFEEKNKVNISYETSQWGKEGEVDFCFKLAELDMKGQLAFIKESKANLSAATHVIFKENEVCMGRR